MPAVQLQDVFKTSGLPTHTFVPPIDYNRIILNLRTPGRALVVEGPSGIGKTTAIKKAIEASGLQQKVNELKASRPNDVEIIKDLPNISEFGIVFIDDFHRLDDPTKAAIADFVKSLADAEQQNAKVIIVGINEAGRSLIAFAPDLVNRIDTIKFENNPDEKISELIKKGEDVLNIEFNSHDDIIQDSNGGFYLAQMLCNELCQKANILEAQATRQKISVSFEGAKSSIWSRLDEKFSDHAKRFALGSRYRPEGRAPYLHLLHALANSEKWHLDIRQYARTNPDMRLSVMQVLDKSFLADLFLSNPTLASVLHLDERAGKLIIEDPQFLFYLRNMPWQTFAHDLGFKQIGFESRYDFALSFAGEDRDVAETIFTDLMDREISVFYDKNEQHRIAAENVEDYLAPIYSSEAKFVVCVLSDSYPRKIWTKIESKHFAERFKLGEVIPVLIKGTSIGVFSRLEEIGFLEIDRLNLGPSITELVANLTKKLEEAAAAGKR